MRAFIFFFIIYLFIFGHIPGNDRGLLLADSGITPGCAWEIIGDVRIEPSVPVCKVNVLLAALSHKVHERLLLMSKFNHAMWSISVNFKELNWKKKRGYRETMLGFKGASLNSSLLSCLSFASIRKDGFQVMFWRSRLPLIADKVEPDEWG